MDFAGPLTDSVEKTACERHYLVPARGSKQRVPTDSLLRLCKRAVGNRDFTARGLMNANGCATKADSLRCNQPARLHALFNELAHGCHFGFRWGAGGGFVCENTDEAHLRSSLGLTCLQPIVERQSRESTGRKIFRSNFSP